MRRWMMRACAAATVVLVFGVGVAELAAQTPYNRYIPYYGKNRVKYDKFEWFIYTTDHFEFYYYPDIEPHLERIAGYAESAYQQISADLKHDLAFKVPIVLFSTQSEFSSRTSCRASCPRAWPPFAEPYRTGWCCRSTSRPISSTGSSRTSSPTSSSSTSSRAASSAAACRSGWTRDSPTTWRGSGGRST